MPINYKKISEASFQKKVLKWLNSIENNYSFKVVKASRNGVHDIISCHNGVFKSTEVKKESGKMTSLQKYHAIEIELAKGKWFEVRPSTFEEYKKAFML